MSRPVVFDTWTWIEILRGSEAGRVATDRYLDDPEREVWTADISLVEAAAALHRDGLSPERIVSAVDSIAARSDRILHPDSRDAVAAPFLRAGLRKRKEDASLADGLILGMARNRGADVVTCDEAFLGEPDVLCPRTPGTP